MTMSDMDDVIVRLMELERRNMFCSQENLLSDDHHTRQAVRLVGSVGGPNGGLVDCAAGTLDSEATMRVGPARFLHPDGVVRDYNFEETTRSEEGAKSKL